MSGAQGQAQGQRNRKPSKVRRLADGTDVPLFEGPELDELRRWQQAERDRETERIRRQVIAQVTRERQQQGLPEQTRIEL